MGAVQSSGLDQMAACALCEAEDADAMAVDGGMPSRKRSSEQPVDDDDPSGAQSKAVQQPSRPALPVPCGPRLRPFLGGPFVDG